MTLSDKLTAKARGRLETQTGPAEQVLHSATVGPVAMVLTNQRLMLATYNQLAGSDLSLPLTAIQGVEWKKGPLGSRGYLTIRTTSQVLEYRTPNNQGEPAAIAIRQAIAAR